MDPGRIRVRILALGPHLNRGESRRRGRIVVQTWGSDHMRGPQLAQLLRPHLPDTVDLRVTRVPRFATGWLAPLLRALPRGEVLWLLKNVAYRLSASDLDALRRRSAAVLADHIDGEPRRLDLRRFDGHVAASLAGLGALRAACDPLSVPTHLLLHHADPALEALPFRSLDRAAPVYLGHPYHLHLPERLRERVSVLPVASPAQMRRALPRLPDFNLHYAMRPAPPPDEPLRIRKPFTKGMTAAACRSNLIVGRDVDDAAALLGEDYPYLVESDEAAAVEAALDAAQSGFGGPEWRVGLDRMAHLRALVAPERLAREFVGIVRSYA